MPSLEVFAIVKAASVSNLSLGLYHIMQVILPKLYFQRSVSLAKLWTQQCIGIAVYWRWCVYFSVYEKLEVMHRVVMTLATIFVIWYLNLQSPNTMGSMQSRNKSIDFKNNTKPMSLCATDFTVNFDWRKCFHNLDLLSKLSVGGSGCLDQKTLYWLTQGCSRLKRCLMFFFLHMARVVRGLQERCYVCISK